MSMPENKQPKDRIGNIPGKKFIAGSNRSQARLKQLGFDPIERLVNLYARLEEEDEYWQTLKQYTSVAETSRTGKTIKKVHKYSGVAHSAVLAQMEKVANDLMRYCYGRVPETVNVNAVNTKPMIVNLSGLEDKKREPLIINHDIPQEEDTDEDSN
jgi:hypothetical protein